MHRTRETHPGLTRAQQKRNVPGGTAISGCARDVSFAGFSGVTTLFSLSSERHEVLSTTNA